MEFFSWVSITQFFVKLFQKDALTLEEYIAQCRLTYLISLPVGAGIFLLGLILGGIALSKMAKREGKKRAYLGFLPFANTYYAGEIAGESYFFGQKMKRAGLYAMIAEIICAVLEVMYLIADLTAIPYYEITRTLEDGTQYVAPNVAAMPSGISWLIKGELYYYWFSWLCSFVELIFLCVLFTALFRKYYARRPIVMTILCALFPFRGVVLFAVRNNTPVDYNEYMRRRMEQQYGSYGYPGGYGPGGYNGGYGQGGYNGGGYNGGSNGSGGGGSASQGGGDGGSDPFGEFGSSSGGDEGPFDEFN